MRYQFELLIIIIFLVNFFIDEANFMIDLFDFWLELVRVIIRLLGVFRLGKLIILKSVVALIKIVLGDWAFFEVVIMVVIQDTIVFDLHVLSLAGRCPHSVVFLTLRFLLLPVQWISFFFFLTCIHHSLIVIVADSLLVCTFFLNFLVVVFFLCFT